MSIKPGMWVAPDSDVRSPVLNVVSINSDGIATLTSCLDNDTVQYYEYPAVCFNEATEAQLARAKKSFEIMNQARELLASNSPLQHKPTHTIH